MEEDIIFFDGDCGFCNRSVMWILHRDHAKRFRFASLQSEHAEERLGYFASTQQLDYRTVNSLVLLSNSHAYFRTEAIIRIAAKLPFPYRMAVVFRIIPKQIRDVVYSWIANNRHRLTSNKHECQLLTPEQRTRFL